MPKNNSENKESSKTSIKRSTAIPEIRSTAVNPSTGPKPKPPAKQPK